MTFKIKRCVYLDRAWFAVMDATGEAVALCATYGAAAVLAGYRP